MELFKQATTQTVRRKTRDTSTEDRVVGLVLRIGAYASIALILAGAVLLIAVSGRVGRGIIQAGVLVLMCTPITRVLVAAAVFWREGDRRYGLVSIGVFAILVITSVLAALKVLPTLEH
jgi:uncharacterized membrane protein